MRAVTITPSTLTHLVEVASSRGATYADARTVEREHEAVSVKDGAVESVTRTADRGLGFRVIHKGSWGFAATDRTDDAALRGVVDEAFRRAEAAASVQRRTVTLAAVAPQRGEYRTTLGRDPFAVPLAERIDHLREVDAASKGPRVKTRRSSIAAYRTRKHLVTSEGTDVSQEIVESGAGLSVLAVKAGAKPAQRYDMRLTRQAGWDDDGVPAMRTKLVDRGTFVGYLTSRETAGALGLPVTIGSARAESWQHFPIVRMVNVSLDPGATPFAELMRGVDSGLLLDAPA